MSVSYCKKSEIESESSKALFASDLSSQRQPAQASQRRIQAGADSSGAGATFLRFCTSEKSSQTDPGRPFQSTSLFAPELSFELPIVVATCEPFPVRWQPRAPGLEPGLTFAPHTSPQVTFTALLIPRLQPLLPPNSCGHCHFVTSCLRSISTQSNRSKATCWPDFD